jgi:2-polyprenyl-3-methyl-5-hydroxy-6-metoxy-1,4-benzoquinol methylase
MPAEHFDAVSAWHVYEHLDDPERVLAIHAQALADGGVLISDSGFRDASTACHHVRTDWDEVLARHGFEAAGPHQYRYAGSPDLEPLRELSRVGA